MRLAASPSCSYAALVMGGGDGGRASAISGRACDQGAWSTVCELLVASLPPKDALPTLSSVYLVCELYVTYCMTNAHVV